jgi:hypothetical protein
MDTESQFPPTENWDVEIEEGGRKWMLWHLTLFWKYIYISV